MTTFSTIFRIFFKSCPKARQTNVSEYFPKSFEDYRRFPKMTEDFQGRTDGEWEGRTGKYLARGQKVRTERSNVPTTDRERNIFPVRPDLTQAISILSYDHLVLKILSLNRTRLHNIRRPRVEQLQRRFYNKNSSFISSRRTRNSQLIEKHDSFSHFAKKHSSPTGENPKFLCPVSLVVEILTRQKTSEHIFCYACGQLVASDGIITCLGQLLEM